MRKKLSNMKMTSMEKLRSQSTLVWKMWLLRFFDRNFTEKPALLYKKGKILTSSTSCRCHCLFLIFTSNYPKNILVLEISGLHQKSGFEIVRNWIFPYKRAGFTILGNISIKKKKTIMTSCEFRFGL